MNHFERLVELATAEVGVKEVGGDNHGPRVEEFQKAVDGAASGESWCMGFVQWALKLVECQMNCESVLFKTEHCMTAWNKTPAAARVPVDKVFPGCVVIWQHDGTTNGHTGIVTAVTAKNIGTIEGNTSDGKGIDRNGNGVYARIRTKTGGGGMTVVGFINPFYPETPK